MRRFYALKAVILLTAALWLGTVPIYSQCGAGETEVQVTITGDDFFAAEQSWAITPDPAGTPDASTLPTAATEGETTGEACGFLANNAVVVYNMCLTNTVTYTFNFYDDYGDSWNVDGTFNFEVIDYVDDPTSTLIGFVESFSPDNGVSGDFSDDCIGNDLEASFEFLAGTGAVATGCTDPCFAEYDPAALIDDGSCLTSLIPDDCTGAEAIVAGYNGPFNTDCATGTGDDIAGASACFVGAIDNGLWFTWVGTGDSVTVWPTGMIPGVDTLDAGTYEDDMQMSVFIGADCSSLTEIDCSQDDVAGPPSSLNFQPQYGFTSTLGTTYYFLIDGYSTNSGEFYLLVDVALCDIGNFAVSASCASVTDFSVNVTWSGTAGDYTVSDGVNSANVTSAGFYNTVTDFAWPVYTAATTVTVTDNLQAAGTPGCSLIGSASLPTNCATCFGNEPAGDFCSTAEVIAVDGSINVGDNTCAGDSGAPVDTDCPSSGFYEGGDLWYQFTTTASCQGSVELRITASAFSTNIWSLHSGCGATSTSVDCNSAGGANTWEISGLDCNTTYYLRLYDFGNDDLGEVTFEVQELACDQVVSLGATCNSTTDSDVVIDLGGSSVYTISDGTNTATGISAGIYSTVNDFSWPAYTTDPTITVFDETQPVGALGCDFSGTATLSTTCESCFGNAPAEDNCSSAAVVQVDGTINVGDNSCASDSGAPVDSDCNSSGFYEGGDLWYQFTTSANCPGTVEFDILSSAFSANIWSLHTGCGATSTSVDCNSTFGLGTWEISGLDCNTTYYLRLFDFSNDDLGEISFTIAEIFCDLDGLTVASNCASSTTFDTDITFTGTSAVGYTITDGTNTATVASAGTYNTVTDLGWPVTGAITLVITDDAVPVGTSGCTLTADASIPAVCECFDGPLANDACAGSEVLNLGFNGPYSILCNSGAADEALPAGVPACFNGGSLHGSWFVWTGTGDSISAWPTGQWDGVDTLLLAEYENDLEWAVFSGDCGALTELYCGQDDVAGPPSGSAFQPQYNFQSEVGVDYYFYADVWGTAAPNGPFYIRLDAILCDLSAITLNTDCISNTEYSTNISFSGITTDGFVISDGTNSETVMTSGSYNTVTDFGWPASTGPLTITVVDSTTPAGSVGCASTASTDLPAFCAECFGNIPDYDICASAASLSEGYNGPFDSRCATNDDDLASVNQPSCFNGGILNGVWFTWMGTGDSVAVYPTSFDADGNELLAYENDLEGALFTGTDCTDLVEVECSQDEYGDPGDSSFQPEFNFSSVEGQMYYFLLDHFGTAVPGGEFNIRVEVFCQVPFVTVVGDPVINCNNPNPTFTGSTELAGATFGWTLPDGSTVEGGVLENVADFGAGTYTFSAADETGVCTDSETLVVTEDFAAPTEVTVAGDVFISCTEPTGTVSGTVSDDATSFEWTDFNGNVVSTELSFDVDVTGINTYTLTAYLDNGCSTSASVQVIPNLNPPTAVATGGGEITCSNLEVSLDGSGSSSVSSYEWLTASGTLVGEEAMITVSAPGTYTLMVTANNGCTASTEIEVAQSTDLPVADAGEGGTITCDVSSVTLDASGSADNVSYSWTDSDGNELTTDVSFETSTAGTYTLTVTDSTTGCSNSNIVGVTASLDLPVVAAGNDVALDCNNSSATLFGSSTAFVPEYNWTDGSGATVGDAQFIIVTTAGSYTLTVTDATSGCVASDEVEVTIDTELQITILDSGLNITCDSPSSTLSVDGAGVESVEWTDGSGAVVGSEITLIVDVAGTYTASASGTNGCSDSASATVSGECVVVPTCEVVAATISTNSPTTICAGDGIADPIVVDVTGGSGMNSAWVITDADLNILALPEGSTIDLEGAGEGVCLIWYVVFDDIVGAEVGMNASNLTGCFELSNSIEVTRLSGADCPGFCSAAAATIATTDATTFCTEDGVDDIVNVTVTGGAGANSTFVVTDGDLNILDITAEAAFNFEGVPVGTCLIWYVTFDDIEGATIGANAGDLTGCYELSNSISVTREGDCAPPTCEVIAATISTNDETTICADDGIGNPIDVASSNGVGAQSAWVITDSDLNILALPAGPPFDLEGAGTGVCIIWQVIYDDIAGVEVGANAADITGCYVLSNGIEVTRLTGADCPSDPCEGFAAIANGVCSSDHSSYSVVIAFTGGDAPNGYDVTNLATGVTISNITAGSYTEGPFPDETTYQYQVSISGQPGCSSEILGGTVSCLATAIELMSFSGEAEERGNLLKWITASEFESEYFLLERSTDGDNFEEIAQIDAAGNSNGLLVYDYMDEGAPEGVSYYRLLERDSDGNIEQVSSVISIERERKGLVLISTSPVPAIEYMNVELSSAINELVVVEIYDASGRLVSTSRVDLTEGVNNFTLDTRELSTGVYVMSVLNGQNAVSTRFVID